MWLSWPQWVAEDVALTESKVIPRLYLMLFVSYNKYLLLWWKEFSLCAVFHLLGRKYWAKRAFIILEFIGFYCLFILKRKQSLHQEVVTWQYKTHRWMVEKTWSDDDTGYLYSAIFQKMALAGKQVAVILVGRSDSHWCESWEWKAEFCSCLSVKGAALT